MHPRIAPLDNLSWPEPGKVLEPKAGPLNFPVPKFIGLNDLGRLSQPCRDQPHRILYDDPADRRVHKLGNKS